MINNCKEGIRANTKNAVLTKSQGGVSTNAGKNDKTWMELSALAKAVCIINSFVLCSKTT
jgi:hypothetical protein